MEDSQPTPYADLNTVLDDLVTSIQAILLDNFEGAYLQGSFAVGEFDEHSDVDFIIVTEKTLSTSEVTALQLMHKRIFATDILWAQHLEGSYFPKAVIQQHADCSQKLWYLDNGSYELVEDNHCNTILVRRVVRDMGIALAGPPPTTLIDPISVVALRREIMAVMHEWGRDIVANPQHYNSHFYQLFILQNYCRMLHDLVQGVPGSKQAGTAWAKANLDPHWHDLIDRSWSGRGNSYVTARQPAIPEDMQATVEFVQFIMDESEKYRYLLDV